MNALQVAADEPVWLTVDAAGVHACAWLTDRCPACANPTPPPHPWTTPDLAAGQIGWPWQCARCRRHWAPALLRWAWAAVERDMQAQLPEADVTQMADQWYWAGRGQLTGPDREDFLG